MLVTGLWRYPVKSMLGERCETLELDARGVKGDRLYAIRNAEGRFGSGKNTRRFRKIDGLFDFTASYVNAVPMLTFPDGTVRRGDDEAIDTALTNALGQSVTLAREAAVPHFDAGPVHLLTSGALAWLKDRLPDSSIDERRFRPNIVIETQGDQVREREWLGKFVMIGDVTLKIQEETERCGMVTFAQNGLRRAPEILRTIAQENELQFGLYADVIVPGKISKGDAVTLGGDWGSYADIL
ncbi:MAG: MOSC domain-containing protein [Alphaproteobacteria bacterium]|nr:MOSC domain-containing protein [Alphaproteobacteria bacterium]